MEHLLFTDEELQTILAVLRRDIQKNWQIKDVQVVNLEDKVKKYLAIKYIKATIKYNKENPDKPQRG